MPMNVPFSVISLFRITALARPSLFLSPTLFLLYFLSTMFINVNVRVASYWVHCPAQSRAFPKLSFMNGDETLEWISGVNDFIDALVRDHVIPHWRQAPWPCLIQRKIISLIPSKGASLGIPSAQTHAFLFFKEVSSKSDSQLDLVKMVLKILTTYTPFGPNFRRVSSELQPKPRVPQGDHVSASPFLSMSEQFSQPPCHEPTARPLLVTDDGN